MWMGISLDEIQRCKIPFTSKWQRNVYPLIENKLTRGHCLEWMQKNNYPSPPRSACLCCPFHSDKEWLRIKNGPSDEWQNVIRFDKEIRKKIILTGRRFYIKEAANHWMKLILLLQNRKVSCLF